MALVNIVRVVVADVSVRLLTAHDQWSPHIGAVVHLAFVVAPQSLGAPVGNAIACTSRLVPEYANSTKTDGCTL